ncbi:uncharacterized protein LOC131849694 [Achroia grisella]|uniref:uncharacterized protein LOC131849694 n=1 Tax=Achroia grisella TaxID=688607 RepID=UPI0027D2CF88|nr:uncharacterized protein LOC131849694 [Achroia grisella]
MGNSCSSGQAHKDKDNLSQHSEESPSYRVTKPSVDASAEQAPQPAHHLLEPTPSIKDKKPLKGPRPVGSSVSDSISLSSPVACASPREDVEGPPMPANVATLPDEHRSYLLGRLPSQRARRRRAMIIYVCAADSQDCCAEKGALQCGAAARLRVRARRRGWRIHVADLHWRSPLEQQRDHRFPVLCIAELARQSELGAVVPILFLNSGLGTPLLPHTLECADFKAALEAAEDENDKSLLNKWYSLDASTTPPCYRLVRGAPARWRREMAKTLNVLVRTLPQEACDAYLTTVVEQEVQHSVLLSVEAARRCVWVCRAGSGAGSGSDAAPDAADASAAHHHELQRRLNNLQKDLKLHLSERNIIRASIRGRSAPGGEDEYTEGVRSALGERLDALLDALIADNDVPAGYNGIPTSLFDEINEHLSFCQKAAQCTSNREITLNELKTYMTGDSNVPLALIGGAGCGKATLVARAASLAPACQQDLALIIRSVGYNVVHTCRGAGCGKATLVARAASLAPACQQDLALIIRFVGLTSQSSSSHLLLKSIVDQCNVLHAGTVYRGRNDVPSLSAALTRLLSALGRARPVLLAVVGADALRGARWLPSRLPDNVKMIVTVTEETDEPSSSAIMAVLSSEDGPKVVRAPPVGPEEAKAVLVACAATYSKTGAASPPEAAVKAVQKCTLPLYAKILAWQISLSAETFTEQSEPETAPELVICEDLEGQLTQILITTEAALGAERVKNCLALLTASRRGLDDTEILDMLAHDELFRSEETYLPWAPASLFWPQLAALLAPWLRWAAGGAARWRDQALAQHARDRYLADNEPRVRRALLHYYQVPRTARARQIPRRQRAARAARAAALLPGTTHSTRATDTSQTTSRACARAAALLLPGTTHSTRATDTSQTTSRACGARCCTTTRYHAQHARDRYLADNEPRVRRALLHYYQVPRTARALLHYYQVPRTARALLHYYQVPRTARALLHYYQVPRTARALLHYYQVPRTARALLHYYQVPRTARALLHYYQGDWYEENDPKMAGRLISQENKFSEECFNTRKLDEIPYQHYHLYKDEPNTFANQPYFTDLSYVYDKLAATDCSHFLEDLDLVHIDPQPEHIQILKEVFEIHSYALDYDHRQFYGLLRTTMEKRQRDGIPIKSEIVENWSKEIWEPPVPTFYAANEDFYKVVENKEKRDVSMVEGFDSKTYDLIVRFDTRGKFVATVSTEREEICVWDVTKCQLVRKLVGVTHPINLVPIDEYRCVVLCRRELRVYDLDHGKFLVALKGVMNQKMPYYGLHDSKHLVALSRNRMYVNLMNIESGDCVTTFKAGEDRFLNSLLVSGDGRILVCGDETQKPFPLLVWSLASRKLLYDLRIPHHDFITSKAAITYEGSYVCVVSRELDEPSPNFIVVYDLQSGTLFKKWKPGCDTVALAISSVDGCVVSGLADTRILVWDLVTGNCRLTLRGHVSAPSLLRLAKSGGVLMSADRAGRDPSVRLWDLHAGKLIAVYTPPERITSCEVLLGGSVLAIALENFKEILCVKLEGPLVESVRAGREGEYDDKGYGDESGEGKTFSVRGSEGC